MSCRPTAFRHSLPDGATILEHTQTSYEQYCSWQKELLSITRYCKQIKPAANIAQGRNSVSYNFPNETAMFREASAAVKELRILTGKGDEFISEKKHFWRRGRDGSRPELLPCSFHATLIVVGKNSANSECWMHTEILLLHTISNKSITLVFQDVHHRGFLFLPRPFSSLCSFRTKDVGASYTTSSAGVPYALTKVIYSYMMTQCSVLPIKSMP